MKVWLLDNGSIVIEHTQLLWVDLTEPLADGVKQALPVDTHACNIGKRNQGNHALCAVCVGRVDGPAPAGFTA